MDSDEAAIPPSEFAHLNCAACGHVVLSDDNPFQAIKPPDTCPECGASNWLLRVGFGDSVTARDEMTYKGFGPHKDKERTKILSGKVVTEVFRKTGRLHNVTRQIDRRNNQYDETISDAETGEVVREVHEPLSEHRGRGSARGRPPSKK